MIILLRKGIWRLTTTNQLITTFLKETLNRSWVLMPWHIGFSTSVITSAPCWPVLAFERSMIHDHAKVRFSWSVTAVMYYLMINCMPVNINTLNLDKHIIKCSIYKMQLKNIFSHTLWKTLCKIFTFIKSIELYKYCRQNRTKKSESN